MTFCAKWKRTSKPVASARCREVQNAAAFLARVQQTTSSRPMSRSRKVSIVDSRPVSSINAVQAACRKRLVRANRRSLSRCCAETRRSRRLVLDRHARRLQQLHQAVAVAAELFGQRLAGATDCAWGALFSFAATLAVLLSISESPSSIPDFLISFSSWSSCAPW